MDLLRELRFATRSLIKTPGFSVVAIAALAFGIAANTTVFSVANFLVLKPLPARDPSSLARVYTSGTANTTYADFAAYREHTRTFAAMTAFQIQTVAIRAGGEPVAEWAEIVSGEYFDVLGLRAAIGRTFLPDEGRTPGSAPVLVLSHAYWTRAFASDPAALGRTVAVNGVPFTIVGVMPAGFTGSLQPIAANLWIPVTMDPLLRPGSDRLTSRTAPGFHILGRLKEGQSIEQANLDLGSIAGTLEAQFPETNRNRTASVYPARMLLPSAQTAVAAFMAFLLVVCGLVLLIACTNVANLLLARSADRRREIAIRQALGAARRRLVRQLLVEGAVLASAAGAIGLACAWAASRLLTAVPIPTPVPIVLDFGIDYRVLAFTLSVTAVTTLLFALVPALHAARVDVLQNLRDGEVGGGYRRSRLRAVFITSQLAMSLLLLITAALFVRNLQQVSRVDIGFDPDPVLAVTMDLESRGYDQARGVEFYQRLLERLKGAPGVAAATLVDIIPMTLSNNATRFGRDDAPRNDALESVLFNSIAPGHFATLGIPLVAGRDFTDQDRAGAARVAIVNETMARLISPDAKAVGEHMRRGDRSLSGLTMRRADDRSEYAIVGIVRDSTYLAAGESPRPFVYLPLAQEYTPAATLLVRATGDPMRALPVVRRAIADVDPDLPLLQVQRMTTAVSISLLPARAAALLLSGMGAMALILVAIGIYGTISYLVRQRTREIGIRVSLGARPADVMRLIVGHTVRWSSIGVAIGLAAGFAVARLLASILYGISATDPITFIGVPAILTLVALAASIGPAHRATRVDPLVILKRE